MFGGFKKAALALLVALFLVPSFASAASFERPLSLGMSGSDVSALQAFLKEKGFYAYPEITGYFGEVTKDALAKYQASVGLEAVGQVGSQTLAILNGGASVPSSALSSLITTLQQLLRNAGYYEVELTGALDSATLAAARSISSGSNDAPKRTGGRPQRSDDEEEVAVGDADAPVVASLDASSITPTVARVTWTTDEPTTSYVEYGTSGSYGSATSSSATTTSHSLTLTGLTPDATYHYRIVSTDTTGNTATSTDDTFESSLAGYKVVATRGFIQYQTTAPSGVNTTEEGRIRQRLTADDLESVRFVFTNKYMNSTTLAETENPYDIPVTAALEWDNPSTYAQVSADNGSIIVPAGTDYFVTDEVTPAMLGLSSFENGDLFWERVSLTMATGTWLQGGAAARIPALNTTGEFMYRHNPPAQQALGTGPMTAAPGGSSQRPYVPTAIVAKVADPDHKALIGIGDSWMLGNNDTDDTTEGGFGFLQQATKWDGARAIATLNLGRASDSSVDFLAGPSHRLELAKLGTHAVITYGINDFVNHSTGSATTTAARTVANLKTIAADLRAEGIEKVAVTTLAPRTSGTFAATSTQISNATWETYRQLVNGELIVGPDFDAILDASTILSDPSFPTKWKANYTNDGIHPIAIGHQALATALKDIMANWGF